MIPASTSVRAWPYCHSGSDAYSQAAAVGSAVAAYLRSQPAMLASWASGCCCCAVMSLQLCNRSLAAAESHVVSSQQAGSSSMSTCCDVSCE
jgi:hypothetical protein